MALVFATLLLAGCLAGQAQGSNAEKASATPADAMHKEVPSSTASPEAMKKETPSATASPQPSVSQEKGAMTEYSGKVLAGSSAKLLDFNKKDFDAAKASGKLVVLYFYADWCPICKQEFPKMQQAFDQLQSDKVVGFRVNYKDDFTDADEVALAREHGVPYQHTKVFVRGSQQLLKSPEGWDKQRYLDEIAKVI